MIEKVALLPCPFCGCSETAIGHDDGIHDVVFAFCTRCAAQGPFDPDHDKDEARSLWNTRAAIEAMPLNVLDWLAQNTRLELTHYSPVHGDDDDQSVEWRVHEQRGSINDREWELVGKGSTPLEALSNARAALERVGLSPQESGDA